MNIVTESVLIESKSARNEQLANTTNERAEEILSKVKALLHFAQYQGDKIASTEAVAEFYEVPEDTVRQVVKRHRDELKSDGLETLSGKQLKDVRDKLSLRSKTPQATVWTPRAALRLGMLLQHSEVAQAVRTSLLDVVEKVVPAQSKRIQELELQLAIAQANRDTVLSQERFLLRNEAIFTMHGAGQLALIQGRPEAVVTETEIVRETVMVDQNLRPVATFNGMGISEIARKLGFTGKNATAQCKNWLKSVGIKDEDWVQEMTAHATPKLPRERLPELKQLWGERKGSRQLLIGE